MGSRFRLVNWKDSGSENEKKSCLAKRRSRAAKASKIKTGSFHLNYDQDNVENTSQIPASYRSYGFLKTNRSATPFPKQSPILEESVIRLRLEAEQLKGHLNSDDKSTIDYSPSELFDATDMESITHSQQEFETDKEQFDEKPSSNLPFELRRRLFDEAEYTIAKGKKMGQNVNYDLDPLVDVESVIPLTKNPGSYFGYFYDIEKMCRNFNIKMAKGFEF